LAFIIRIYRDARSSECDIQCHTAEPQKYSYLYNAAGKVKKMKKLHQFFGLQNITFTTTTACHNKICHEAVNLLIPPSNNVGLSSCIYVAELFIY